MRAALRGYSTGMDLAAILRTIDARQEELHMSDAALSKKAGFSPDLIRNWRRRIARGESHAGVNAHSLEAIASALDLPAGALSMPPDYTNGSARPPGFAESEARPWAPADTDRKARLLAALAPDARHPESYTIAVAIPGFDLAEGDVVVIDLGRTPVTDEIVVANVDDFAHHAQTTVLRRYLPPYLVPGRHTEKSDLVESQRIGILGPVVASFRPMAGLALA